jgi:hypothetical protein
VTDLQFKSERVVQLENDVKRLKERESTSLDASEKLRLKFEGKIKMLEEDLEKAKTSTENRSQKIRKNS